VGNTDKHTVLTSNVGSPLLTTLTIDMGLSHNTAFAYVAERCDIVSYWS